MAKQNEISSTEKLLELIRDEGKGGPAAAGIPAQQPQNRLRTIFSHPVSFKRSIAVGVDMGRDDLKLIKINRISDQKFEMLDYVRVPLSEEYPRESPQFFQFLRATLDNFCGGTKSVDIWTTISSARVETRQLRIPKVPPKQIPNSVFWTHQRLSSFDEKDRIFDFEVLGEIDQDGGKKLDIMSYTAPRSEVLELKELFSKAGFPLTGISIVPFAFQTLIRAGRIGVHEHTVSSLYIGRNWSRIDIFSEGTLMLSRGIKAGIRTMTEALQTEIEQNWFELSLAKSPTKDSTRIRALKKRLKYELEQAKQLFFGGIHDESAPGTEQSKQIALTEDRILRMILPALERLVRQIERTLKHFSMNFENSRVEKLYISSGVSLHPRILHHIESELGLPAETVNPFADSDSFLSMVPIPEMASERSSYAPAMGMALANNTRTPNFLYTYKEKKKDVNSQRVNRSVFAAFAALLAVCVGVSFWQDNRLEEKEYRKNQLQQQLQGYNLRVDRTLILNLVDKIKEQNATVKNVGMDYLGVAVMSEISRRTPDNVRLTNISATVGKTPVGEKEKKEETAGRVVTLEGIIQGNRLGLESDLARYLMELQKSPLFDQPAIKKKSFEFFEDQEVLRFSAKLELV